MLDSADNAQMYLEWIEILDHHEAEIIPRLEKIIVKAFKRTAVGVREEVVARELRDALRAALEAHYKRVVRSVYAWGMRQSPVKSYNQLERKGVADAAIGRMLSWIVAKAFEKSVLASESIMGAVRKVLGAGLRQSEVEEAEAIRKALNEEGKAVSRRHARLIARQETSTASDEAADEAIKQHEADGVQVLGKQWVTSGDHRVRPTHRVVVPANNEPQGDVEGDNKVTVAAWSREAVEDQVRRLEKMKARLRRKALASPSASESTDIARQINNINANIRAMRNQQDHVQQWPVVPRDGKFLVGGFLADRPRDPELWAEAPHEAFNCRCVLAYVTDPGRFKR